MHWLAAMQQRPRIAGIIREDRAAADHLVRISVTFIPGFIPCASNCRRMSSCTSRSFSWEGACDLASAACLADQTGGQKLNP